MMMRHAFATAITVLVLSVATGCGEDPQPRPPEILYGQQECEQCRMIISDDRYAAGLAVDRGDGRIAPFAFDDVNCMFDFEREQGEAKSITCYVHDCMTRRWLDAASAQFLISDALQTPMASGVAAAASREALDPLRNEHGGEFIDFAALRERFMPVTSRMQGTTP